MKCLLARIAILSLLNPCTVWAAGFQMTTAPDPGQAALEVAIWYPSNDATSDAGLVAFDMDVAKNGAISGDHHPLIVMSPRVPLSQPPPPWHPAPPPPRCRPRVHAPGIRRPDPPRIPRHRFHHEHVVRARIGRSQPDWHFWSLRGRRNRIDRYRRDRGHAPDHRLLPGEPRRLGMQGRQKARSLSCTGYRGAGLRR